MNSEGFKETEIGLIPKDWNVDNLEKYVVTIFCGRDPKGGKKSHSTEPTNYRIIQSAPVFDGYLSREKVGYVKEDIYFNLESASLKENDVLLNQLGDGITFARSCVVPKDVLPAIITRSVGCIRCDEKVLDPWFLNAYLVLPRTKKYIESFNSGSSRRAIDGGKMRSFIIPLPPLNEQKKLGQFYKLILDKIELNNEMNRTLEAIGQAIFQHWFVHFEFPNSEGLPYKSSGGEMVDSELGEIPVGWKVGKLGDIISITSGKRPVKKSDTKISDFIVPLIGASSLMGFVKEILYQEPILVIGRVGTHGIVQRVLPPSHPSDNTLVMKSKFYEFIYQILKRIDYESLNVGTTQPLITQKSIKTHEIIIPTEKILKNYEEIVSKLFFKLEANKQENNYLSDIRDTLLPKLMSGKIRVNIPEEATVK